MLGYEIDYDVFDMEIIMFINSAFGRLQQLGLGPVGGNFRITGYDETWPMFNTNGHQIDEVIEFVYLSVKLVFDPPQNSFLVTAIKENLEKKEWLLNCQAETPYYQ